MSHGQKAVEDTSDVKLSLANISASWERGPGQQPPEEVYMFVYVILYVRSDVCLSVSLYTISGRLYKTMYTLPNLLYPTSLLQQI